MVTTVNILQVFLCVFPDHFQHIDICIFMHTIIRNIVQYEINMQLRIFHITWYEI